MVPDIQIADSDIDEFVEGYNASLSDDAQSLEFDERRRATIRNWDDLQACPGSGKTTLVATKLIILARKWSLRHRGICVLTHTNVACDEIKYRVESDRDGCRLLSYPHFIGTIQEFVNRFVALPAIRNADEGIRFVEDGTGRLDVLSSGENLNSIYSSLRRKLNGAVFDAMCECLGTLHWLNTDYDLGFFGPNGNLITFRNSTTATTYPKLKALKEAIQSKGRYQYKDMYVIADDLLNLHSDLASSLQYRFPVIFVDEMQDMQKFQDELINKIFGGGDVNIQRFGDPDQAIFDNIGDGEPNETFNGNTSLETLNHSHRFTADIASKVSPLSLSQIGVLETRDAPNPPLSQTVIVFDNDTKTDVLSAFSNIVAESDPDNCWKTVKAVGATEGSGGHISSYWSGFDKKKQVTNPRPDKLILAVRRKWWKSSDHSSAQYKLIVQSVLDLLRICNVLDTSEEPSRYFNSNSLRSRLRDNDQIDEFRAIVTNWIMKDTPSEDEWRTQVMRLREIVGVSENDAGDDYLAYSNTEDDTEENVVNDSTANLYNADNGREIEVGTIHSVKGETHDATLVLETKFYQNDVGLLLDHIAGLDTSPITKARKIKFARQLYVAMSRARHLVCLAIHSENVSDAQEQALRDNGWDVRRLTPEAGL